ncbi:MAG: hypothetical protein JSW62_04415 [Thermoplasmatales archaeon]|jgi:hypothetical protein|nr:MAG: hypothetical protein JSW62_04415 [Thermoplasmatales archaeon]
MDLKEGDLVITLPKVAKIQAIVNLNGGEMGIVVETGAEFNEIQVYAVSINGQIYYLFADEIMKLEEEC